MLISSLKSPNFMNLQLIILNWNSFLVLQYILGTLHAWKWGCVIGFISIFSLVFSMLKHLVVQKSKTDWCTIKVETDQLGISFFCLVFGFHWSSPYFLYQLRNHETTDTDIKPNAQIALPHKNKLSHDSNHIIPWQEKAAAASQQTTRVCLGEQIEVEPPNSTNPTTRAQYLPA